MCVGDGWHALGNLTRIENELAKLPARLEAAKTNKSEIISQLENAKVEVEKPFAFGEELKEKTDRLNTLNIELNLDEKDPFAIDTEPEQDDGQLDKLGITQFSHLHLQLRHKQLCLYQYHFA